MQNNEQLWNTMKHNAKTYGAQCKTTQHAENNWKQQNMETIKNDEKVWNSDGTQYTTMQFMT